MIKFQALLEFLILIDSCCKRDLLAEWLKKKVKVKFYSTKNLKQETKINNKNNNPNKLIIAKKLKQLIKSI